MARPIKEIEGSLAGELYHHFLEFIDKQQTIPIERAFWRWLTHPKVNKYTREALPENKFRYHFDRLVQEGYIRVEHKTRALSVAERRIVPINNEIDP